MVNTRLLLTFLSVVVLLVPLLLPEYLSPAQIVPGFDTLHHLVADTVWFPAVVVAALVGGVLCWRASPTKQTAALFALVVLWIARTPGSVDLFFSSSSSALASSFLSELPVRATLAAAVLLGTAGALMRWQSARAGFLMIGAATVAYTAAATTAAASSSPTAANDASSAVAAVATGGDDDVTSMAADAPRSSSSSAASSSATAAEPIVLVPVRVSVNTAASAASAGTDDASTTSETRQAPYAVTLEEHMVQLRAPPNQATVNWNAPAYGAALGMGTRAACGSFKSDNSKVTRKMEKASGHFV